MRSLAVVGGSLAAVSATRALRTQGFDGRITVISGEQQPPYDRPPLSKSFLLGTVTAEDIGLLDDPAELDLDWRAGLTATALNPRTRSVELSDGTTAVVDGVVLATGARPRRPWPAMPGIHAVRTLDDAIALRAEMRPSARLVVVGAGYLGSEIASAAHVAGMDVTVVESSTTPLAASLGTKVGSAFATVHARSQVTLLTGVGVSGFDGGHRVERVLLADGRSLSADVVVVAIGVMPNTEWLTGSGLDLENGVGCDAFGVTDVPNVVAVGDCAAWYEPCLGRTVRSEHWTAAHERGGIAVASLLTGGAARSVGRPPFVWSDQYGLRLQIVGHPRRADSVTLEAGSLDELDFLAVYRLQDEVVAVVAVGHAREFMRWRKLLATPSSRTIDTLSTAACTP